jgi:hypothetical protein
MLERLVKLLHSHSASAEVFRSVVASIAQTMEAASEDAKIRILKELFTQSSIDILRDLEFPEIRTLAQAYVHVLTASPPPQILLDFSISNAHSRFSMPVQMFLRSPEQARVFNFLRAMDARTTAAYILRDYKKKVLCRVQKQNGQHQLHVTKCFAEPYDRIKALAKKLTEAFGTTPAVLHAQEACSSRTALGMQSAFDTAQASTSRRAGAAKRGAANSDPKGKPNGSGKRARK